MSRAKYKDKFIVESKDSGRPMAYIIHASRCEAYAEFYEWFNSRDIKLSEENPDFLRHYIAFVHPEDETDMLDRFKDNILKYKLFPDTGRWTVESDPNDWKVFIFSDDFTHDVKLQISGDWANKEDQIAYAEALCSQMNSVIKREVKCPCSSCSEYRMMEAAGR